MSRHRGSLSHSLPTLPSTQGFLVGFFLAIFNLHLLPIGSRKGMKHRGIMQTRGTLRPMGQVKRQDAHGAVPGCCHLGRAAPGHSPWYPGQVEICIPRAGPSWQALCFLLNPCSLHCGTLTRKPGRARGWAFPLDSEESKQEKS